MKSDGSASMPWARAALDLLYPPTCSFCDKRLLPDEQTVCDPCRASMLPADTWRCPNCGATGTGRPPDQTKNCPRCPPPDAKYAGVLSVSRYAEPAVRRCVQLFKYKQRLEMGRLMADMMIVRMGNPLGALDDRVEWVVPVPLHWRRRVGRGFNQAGLLAEPLAEALQNDLQGRSAPTHAPHSPPGGRSGRAARGQCARRF